MLTVGSEVKLRNPLIQKLILFSSLASQNSLNDETDLLLKKSSSIMLTSPQNDSMHGEDCGRASLNF